MARVDLAEFVAVSSGLQRGGALSVSSPCDIEPGNRHRWLG